MQFRGGSLAHVIVHLNCQLYFLESSWKQIGRRVSERLPRHISLMWEGIAYLGWYHFMDLVLSSTKERLSINIQKQLSVSGLHKQCDDVHPYTLSSLLRWLTFLLTVNQGKWVIFNFLLAKYWTPVTRHFH